MWEKDDMGEGRCGRKKMWKRTVAEEYRLGPFRSGILGNRRTTKVYVLAPTKLGMTAPRDSPCYLLKIHHSTQ